jgi:di/tricarboxylate transporter
MLRTGVADRFGKLIVRLSGPGEARIIVVIMITCGVMSAFINNVGATAMLMPAVLGIARQTRIPASKLLIPLAFSSLLGGKMTLIGTPANILATGVLAEKGLETFGFFEFAPIGIVVLATGVVFMGTVGRRLLPVRVSLDERKEEHRSREYVSEVRVLPDGRLAGRTLLESRLGADFNLNVVALTRQSQVHSSLHRDSRIMANDVLLVQGPAANLFKALEALGLALEADEPRVPEGLEGAGAHVVEATLAPRSSMAGRTLDEMHFRDRYGFTVLAVYRHGEAITQPLRDVRLQFGDALLLRGPRHRLPTLSEGDDFLILEPFEMEERRQHKAPIAAGIMAVVLGLVVLADVDIALAMVAGSVLMVLTGCLTMDEAYDSIDWRTVFLVAGMLPLGIAMDETGTARFLATALLGVVGDFGPYAALAGIYVLSAAITQPMSNAAAIVLLVPIAVDTAFGLGANHLTFTMAVIIGAATSFLTPVGHKANVLVFGPGGYRFFDYTRVGLPLTVALFIVSMIFIPIFWPLY